MAADTQSDDGVLVKLVKALPQKIDSARRLSKM